MSEQKDRIADNLRWLRTSLDVYYREWNRALELGQPKCAAHYQWLIEEAEIAIDKLEKQQQEK